MVNRNSARYEDIQIDLQSLYHTAKVRFPEKAADCAGIAGEVESAISQLDHYSASAYDPPPLVDAINICEDVHEALRELVKSLDFAAVGLLNVATAFAIRDDDAKDAFHRLSHGMDPHHPVPPPRVPYGPELPDSGTGGEVAPPPPPSLEDDLETRNNLHDRLGGGAAT